jgi:RNA polymerase sigma-70 factor (ECF subfamily)
MIAGAVFDFHDAEDIVAEVAETVVRQFHKYDTSQPYLPWVFGIARNLLLRYYQRKAAVRHTYLNEKELQLVEAVHLKMAEEIPARQAALHECIKSIQGKSRRVLEMRYGHDLKPEAVANALGMKCNAVWVMLHRIRAALRECINQKMQTKNIELP